jgi:hypothetical protein
MMCGSRSGFFSIPDPDPDQKKSTGSGCNTANNVWYITLHTHFDYSYCAFREVKAFIDECLNRGGKVLGK